MQLIILIAAIVVATSACSSDSNPPDNDYRDTGVDVDLGVPDVSNPEINPSTERLFPTQANAGRPFDDCMFASPLAFEGVDGPEVIAVAGETVAALSPTTGEEIWSVTLPAPEGERAFTLATPGVFDERFAVFTYHTTTRNEDTNDGAKGRIRHMASVVDLRGRRVAEDYEPIELDGPFPSPQGMINFPASNALGRAQVAIAGDTELRSGYAYITFGNARDIQPWHGFAFEINLDSWAAGAGIVSGRLVTTPETDCGQSGVSGSRDRLCGGGLWAPSGPLVVNAASEEFELILAPGNGQLDLARGDYANTLMRLKGRGLAFDPGCDQQACVGFDPDEPAKTCVESCQNLFVPRMLPEDGPLRPESGVCEDMTMFECWQKLDYIGGSTPVYVPLPSGKNVLAYPTKDGAVYLVDADRLGTLYDREQLVAVCGTADDACTWDWAGMIVSQPALTEFNGVPLIIVPTFMPDRSHPAGVVALRIVEDSGTPQLEVVWQAPNFSSSESITRFRQHPSRPAIQTLSNGVQIAWVAEALRGGPGNLMGIRIWDGKIVDDRSLAGPGNRFTKPLVMDDLVFVPSCGTDRDSSFIEGYRVNED